MIFREITQIHKGAVTRLITAENVYGEKGRGGMAEMSEEPSSEIRRIGQHHDGGAFGARELGQKWKVRPCIFPCLSENMGE